MDSNKDRANLREIPEDVSVRKPPLKKKKRGDKRTLTLENDEVGGTLTLKNDGVGGMTKWRETAPHMLSIAQK